MATVLDNEAARLLVDFETTLMADDDVVRQRREGGLAAALDPFRVCEFGTCVGW